MTTLKSIEQHVLEDAAELISCIGVVNPLSHTTLVIQMQGERQRVAEFLRAILSRQIILISTRLHGRIEVRKKTEVASIESYLHYAELEGRLSAEHVVIFRSVRQTIITKLDLAGIRYDELLDFRHSELAHSLHRANPLKNRLNSRPIFDFAHDTLRLVASIETAVSRSARLDGLYQEWLDRGTSFWSAESSESASGRG